jgi:hypothetical protein
MNTKLLKFVLVFSLSLYFGCAQANCYVLKNNTNHVITFNFNYNTPIGPGMPLSATVAAGQQYPLGGGQWCLNTPNGFYATIGFSGNGNPSWKGALMFGNGPLGATSGTYSVN